MAGSVTVVLCLLVAARQSCALRRLRQRADRPAQPHPAEARRLRRGLRDAGGSTVAGRGGAGAGVGLGRSSAGSRCRDGVNVCTFKSKQ